MKDSCQVSKYVPQEPQAAFFHEESKATANIQRIYMMVTDVKEKERVDAWQNSSVTAKG